MNIRYDTSRNLSIEEFVDVLNRSTLSERRPVDDPDAMRGMVENTNLIVTAWDDDLLVGVARCMTDFHYACYLSELAVDQKYHRQGIGKTLLQKTHEQLGPKCKLMLVAAPPANGYYYQRGFELNDRTWILPRGKAIEL